MISVIVYGRNDTHGYNHHRRVALSLNCLAEVLTDPDDEILFVDYNTPDELPTAIEALADTLTDRALKLLRVLRVPASLHTERYCGRTHLSVVEPVARNVAARRANPSNRWLLATNTDMILIPLHGDSLSEICGDLPDGFYGLPRFELPEWVWERLPRADPQRTLAEVGHLGPALHLDEPTLSHEWVRFDAPGDFQLMLREDLLAIDGFDEEMLLGWHIDSNLTRRMHLHRGSIGTLEGSVAGYHCNHSRVPTVYHGVTISNDIDRFFYSVEVAELPAQRATWGLVDDALEAVPLQRQVGSAFVDALLATLPTSSGPRPSSDAAKASYGISYDSGHVLPFIADSLVVSPLTTVGYLGINPILQQMVTRLVEELGLGCNMTVAELADANGVEEFAQSADLFVVDLGTDQSLVEASNVARPGDESALIPVGFGHIPAGFDLVFAALERLVEAERARLALGAHPRRIVLVNSSTVFLDAYALAEFDCSSTTTHCRVRRATVKKALGDDEASKKALLGARAVARWALGHRGAPGGLRLTPGETVLFANLAGTFSLSAGWAFPDTAGVWTWGSRSEMSIAFPPVDDSDRRLVVVLVIDAVCVAPDEALRVGLLIDGVRVANRNVSEPDVPFAWRVEVPPSVLYAGSADLTITVDEPRSPRAVGWSGDERPLGVRLRSLTLREVNYTVKPPQSVAFGAEADGERLLAAGWYPPEATGVWTAGDHARLVLDVSAEPLSGTLLVLDVVPYLTPEHAELTVDVWSLDTHLAQRVFHYGDVERGLVLHLPVSVRDETGRTVLDLRIDEPARPVDLGMSPDTRRLGLFLRSLTLDGRLAVHTGETTEFAQLADLRGFGDGWDFSHREGFWTTGHRTDLALTLAAASNAEHRLLLSIGSAQPPIEGTRDLELLVNGVQASVRPLTSNDSVFTWRVDLPAQVVVDGAARLTVVSSTYQPTVTVSPDADIEERGIRIDAIRLEQVDRSVGLGQAVSFIEGSDAERLLGDGWSGLEPSGVWTIGESARVVVQLPADAGTDLELVLGADAFVTQGHPVLDVVLTAGTERLGTQRFRHGVKNRVVSIPLMRAAVDAQGRVAIDIGIGHPVSPKELGTGSDTRPLGLHLKWLMVRRTGVRGQWDTLQHRLRLAILRRRPAKRRATPSSQLLRFRPVASSVSD